MKRCVSLLLMLLLLVGCAAPTSSATEGQSASPTAAPASSAAADQPTATAAPLADPTDAARTAAGDFSIVTKDGAFTEENGVYTITKAGDYTLSGVLAEGQILIDAGDGDKVKLILNNAAISNSTDAPILARNGAELTVKAESDSYNTVDDLRTGDANALENAEDNHDAAIWAACDLKLTGSGTLIVTSSFDNGVKSKDDLSVKNQTLKVTAPGNALKGNDSVTIQSGQLMLISTASDGIKTENTDLSAKGKQRGTVSIEGGQIEIYAACDGISAAYDVEIAEEESCAVTVYTASYASTSAPATAGSETYLIVPTGLYSDQYEYYVCLYNEDETAGVWVKCAYETMVYSGRTTYYGLVFKAPAGYQNILIHIVSAGTVPNGENYAASTTGETINTAMNGYLITGVSGSVISGDWVTLTSGRSGNSNKTTYSAKGIKAANEIIITGGAITVYAKDDGLHANGGDSLDNCTKGLGNITVSGGTVTVTAADDGLHADNALTVQGGTVNVLESHEGLEGNLITIAGGAVYVYADDDGINACAGSATPLVSITGGYVEVTTPSGDTDAIDSNGSFTMSGGQALVKSGSTMGGMAGSVDVDGSVTVTGGTIVALGGICEVPSGSSVNYYAASGVSFSAGDYALTDGSGNAIFAFTLSNTYSSCWIASDAFQLNGSYALMKGTETVLSWTQTSSAAGDGSGGWGGFGGWGGGSGRGGWGGRH